MSNEPSADRSIILVVEDEPLLRMFASDMVEDAGYSVVEAANATEAVSILEKRTDIRIVFTDIDMPHGIDG
ncbi:MAG: response regulator, partial [Sphingomonas sp.]